MKTIPLTQGKFALVDEADYEAVSQFKWYANKLGAGFYARRNIRNPDGTRGYQFLHQFLMPGVAEIDHINGDGLNNSREKNLRPATRKQNSRAFRRKSLGTSSKFRGVSWYKLTGKWKACLKFNYRPIHIGYYSTEIEAARARDTAALKYFGKNAHLNFPL